jgi:hypothetical protein
MAPKQGIVKNFHPNVTNRLPSIAERGGRLDAAAGHFWVALWSSKQMLAEKRGEGKG